MKQVIFRIAAFAIFFLIGLGIAEICLRVVPTLRATHRSPEPSAFERHSRRGPDFRDRSQTVDPDAFRLLVVGDSFTWGGGVYSEDAYPDRMQVRIDRAKLATERPIHVINWSRPGWNTVQELSWLKRRRPGLDADLLILGICLNDPEPTKRSERRLQRVGMARRMAEGPIESRLYAWSRLYALAFERLENQRQRRVFNAYYRTLYEPSPDWQAFVDALKGFRFFAGQHRTPLLLVVFPIFGAQLERYPYTEQHEALRRTAKQLNIPALDLLPAYAGIDARRLAVEPFTDSHPSELAHRIAADRILRYLIDNALIPVRAPGGEAGGGPGDG